MFYWIFFKTENKIELDIIPNYFNYRKYSLKNSSVQELNLSILEFMFISFVVVLVPNINDSIYSMVTHFLSNNDDNKLQI